MDDKLTNTVNVHTHEDFVVRTGQWHWVDLQDHKGVTTRTMMCVVKIGSNFAELHAPTVDGWGTSIRILSKDFRKELTPVDDAQTHIQEKIAFYQKALLGTAGRIKELMSSLGVTPQLTDDDVQENALTVVGSNTVSDYKGSLEDAKKNKLPELYHEMEKDSKNLQSWLSAVSLGLTGDLNSLHEVVKKIDARIFNIGLYAGLTEKVTCLREGKPADRDAQLHVMQRRLYMDEECLLDYDSGGMDFENIQEFGDWLAKPQNLDRILPFPRTMVSFQVRRRDKERAYSSPLSIFINMNLREDDKTTFLFIRNGEQLWQLRCDLDFGEMMFPDDSEFNPGQPMYLSRRGTKIISKGLYDDVKASEEAHEAWEKANPFEEWVKTHPLDHGNGVGDDYILRNNWHSAGPAVKHIDYHDSTSEYQLFDQNHKYYDEGMALIKDKIQYYNRVALVIQGLLDRSEALAPHPKWETWTMDGFAAAIELVFDSSRALTYGDPPDFEAYRAAGQQSIALGSYVIGQRYKFEKREARKFNTAIDNDWKLSWEQKSYLRKDLYTPEGNPGPQHIERVLSFDRQKKAVFRWMRDRSWRARQWDSSQLPDEIHVGISELFNVSAYKAGDYLQFFQDPRTRQDYLQWAPTLLAAEAFVTGKWEAGLKKRFDY